MGIFSAAIELLSNGGVSQQTRPLGSRSDNEGKTKSTVLVIDDDPMLLQTVKDLLVKHGVDVLTSSSAKKGLETLHYAAGDIRIVVLDYNMAKISGDEMLKFIRQYSPNAKVIGLTDMNPDSMTAEYLEGIDVMLNKPVVASTLIAAVGELLGIEQTESAAVRWSATLQQGAIGTNHPIIVKAPVSGHVSVGDGLANHPTAKVETQSNPPALAPPPAPAPSPPPISLTITAKEIRDTILAAPPIQRAVTAESYKGQPIDWNCRWFVLHKQKDSDTVGVLLDWSDEDSLTCRCEVLLTEYPQLRVMPPKTPVRIIGTVQAADAYDITIKDPKLFF